jgi:hypothetical protein
MRKTERRSENLARVGSVVNASDSATRLTLGEQNAWARSSKTNAFGKRNLRRRAVAQIGQDDVQVEPGEVLIERKIVPAPRDRSAPFGLILLLAFIVTCVVVFFGERLGIRAAPSQTTAQSVTQ